MNFRDYQKKALLTSSKPDSKEKAIAIWCMGLAGETGEAIDYLKKVVAHGHKLDRDRIALELGDVLWYLAGWGHFSGSRFTAWLGSASLGIMVARV